MLPIIALWLNVESILLALQQEPCVARYMYIKLLLYCKVTNMQRLAADEISGFKIQKSITEISRSPARVDAQNFFLAVNLSLAKPLQPLANVVFHFFRLTGQYVKIYCLALPVS